MKKNMLAVICSLYFVIQIMIMPVYGHGFGADTVSSIDINDKRISITVKTPMTLENDSDKPQQVLIEAKDEKTKKNVKELTLLLGLYHDGKMIFRNYFYSPDGKMLLEISHVDDSDVKITGKQEDLLGSYYATENNPAKITGSVFESGGLYDFEMEIRTIDDPKNVIDDSEVYRATVSIAETQYFPVSVNGDTVTFKVKSYFDSVKNFNYDVQNHEISFEMPFDWSASNISHVPVVHVEVLFSKEYETLLHPNYSGKINGVDLFKSIVTIDDYTHENDRIVHFVLLQDHLRFIKNQQEVTSKNNFDKRMVFLLKPSQTIDFPITAMTKNEELRVDLSWEPVTIEPQQDTKFIFTIRDGSTGEPLRNSSYKFVIVQDGKELYRTDGNAQIGGGAVEYQFKEHQTGPTTIKFEDIRNTGQGTEFSILVTPEFGPLSMVVLAILLISSLILLRKYHASGLLLKAHLRN